MGSGPWSESTKRWVIAGLIVGGAALVLRVRTLLPPVILACLLAYLLNPLVAQFMRWRLSRTKATIVTYLLLLLAVVLGAAILVPVLVQQISSIDVDIQKIYEGLLSIMGRYETITFLDYSIQLSEAFELLQANVVQMITSFASRSAEGVLSIVLGVASGFASTFVWMLFMVVVSFWVLRDADEIARVMVTMVPAEYRDETENLRRRIAEVWDSFFRGLLLLSLAVGAITTVILWLLGVKNALLLGILAAVLEVVPSIGPIVACIPAVIIAYFQASSHLPLGPGWFALLVLGAYVLIQQIENNFLAPRILGRSVRLHPVVVLVGAIGGYAVGGIVGAFLAAPVIGTLKILGQYLYRKLTEPPLPAGPPPAVERPKAEVCSESNDTQAEGRDSATP